MRKILQIHVFGRFPGKHFPRHGDCCARVAGPEPGGEGLFPFPLDDGVRAVPFQIPFRHVQRMRSAQDNIEIISGFIFQTLDDRLHCGLVVEVAVETDREKALFHLSNGFDHIGCDAGIGVCFKTVGVELRRERENSQIPDHFKGPPRDQPLGVHEENKGRRVHGFW